MKRWLAAFLPSVSPVAADQPLTLADVAAGHRARVCRLLDIVGAETLRERGLRETAEVRVIADGDPLVCSVLGVRLTLNRQTAQGILVERL
ncbi:MAG: hypothetical protein CFK52_13920 [Chloracidobacterium sp. CP2_5A]|nr:MAG: hypothetical protein CFK52_13920 [Chloracidobacterium sp. CP2_5A]